MQSLRLTFTKILDVPEVRSSLVLGFIKKIQKLPDERSLRPRADSSLIRMLVWRRSRSLCAASSTAASCAAQVASRRRYQSRQTAEPLPPEAAKAWTSLPHWKRCRSPYLTQLHLHRRSPGGLRHPPRAPPTSVLSRRGFSHPASATCAPPRPCWHRILKTEWVRGCNEDEEL